MRRAKQIHLTIVVGAAATLTACGPDPIPMTADNVPRFSNRTECVRQYGEEHCRYNAADNYYHPAYVPGSTYYYPGRRGGYYGGSPTPSSSPSFRSSTYSSPGGISTSSTSSRGGFISSSSFGGS